MAREAARHVIGAISIDLIKLLKNLERSGTVLRLSVAASEVLGRRIVPTEWIALEVFLEYLAIVDAVVLKGSERRALEMGAEGGPTMRALQKAYCVAGDPLASVISMRHGWRAHYDFGRITQRVDGERAVTYVLEGYPDMPMVHGMMTAGWGLAAARTAGASSASVDVLSRPWTGDATLAYTISF